MKKALALAALLATTAGISTSADAAITVYTSLAAFNAATSAQGADTFNNLTPAAALALSLNRTAGTYAYTVASANGTPGSSSLYGAGSAADAWISNNLNADSIIFNGFGATVRGVGANFFGSDVNGLFVAPPAGNSLTLTATDASGTITQILLNATTTSFLGFVSTTGITSVTVAATVPANSYWATANNLVVGGALVTAAVPEPATWLMMIGGFGLVGGAMRRRARVSYAAANA